MMGSGGKVCGILPICKSNDDPLIPHIVVGSESPEVLIPYQNLNNRQPSDKYRLFDTFSIGSGL